MSDTLWSICTDFFFPRRIELRSDKTRRAYRLAINHFGRHLGHVPTLADLDDDLVAVWVGQQLDAPGSVYSVRERMGRLLSLWRFLAARGKITLWPTIKRPAAPDPVPVALTQEQLHRLFEAAMYEPGKIDGVRAGWWWQAYLGFVWSTAERRTAALSLRCLKFARMAELEDALDSGSSGRKVVEVQVLFRALRFEERCFATTTGNVAGRVGAVRSTTTPRRCFIDFRFQYR